MPRTEGICPVTIRNGRSGVYFQSVSSWLQLLIRCLSCSRVRSPIEISPAFRWILVFDFRPVNRFVLEIVLSHVQTAFGSGGRANLDWKAESGIVIVEAAVRAARSGRSCYRHLFLLRSFPPVLDTRQSLNPFVQRRCPRISTTPWIQFLRNSSTQSSTMSQSPVSPHVLSSQNGGDKKANNAPSLPSHSHLKAG